MEEGGEEEGEIGEIRGGRAGEEVTVVVVVGGGGEGGLMRD